MDPSWKPLFDAYEFGLDDLYASKVAIYPAKRHVFRVFQMPIQEIQVVLLGQDPYPGYMQAHGLSFSVPKGVVIPPSLRNIFQEIQTEFPERNYIFKHGCLESWEQKGIFLLNSALTVEAGKPGTHSELWSDFTDDVIRFIAEQNSRCVFLLLGSHAKAKAPLISDETRIVTGVHPSPNSADKGFFGSGVFKAVEECLGSPVDWSN